MSLVCVQREERHSLPVDVEQSVAESGCSEGLKEGGQRPPMTSAGGGGAGIWAATFVELAGRRKPAAEAPE